MSLERKTPLRRTAMKRTASKPRRPRDTGPSATTKDLVWARAAGRCELCGDTLAGMRGFSRHHRRPRRMGGSRLPDTNSPANILLVCGSATSPDGCHHRIESNREQAYAEGLLLHDGQNPAEVPVLIACPIDGWPKLVLLTHDGTYTEPPRPVRLLRASQGRRGGDMPDVHRVTLLEASKRLSVPMGTLYAWASRGSITPMAIQPDGTKWYSLHELESLNRERTRRKGTRHA